MNEDSILKKHKKRKISLLRFCILIFLCLLLKFDKVQPTDSMNTSKSLFTLVTLFSFLALNACAQESVHASGGDLSGTGGSVAFSIGIPVYTAEVNSNGRIAQGVQHAYDIFPEGVTTTEFEITLSVFPNPSQDLLTLNVLNCKRGDLSFTLRNLQGQIMQRGRIQCEQTQIPIDDLAQANYLLCVYAKDKPIQTFTIIKY